jgi:hypothetical protein
MAREWLMPGRLQGAAVGAVHRLGCEAGGRLGEGWGKAGGRLGEGWEKAGGRLGEGGGGGRCELLVLVN